MIDPCTEVMDVSLHAQADSHMSSPCYGEKLQSSIALRYSTGAGILIVTEKTPCSWFIGNNKIQTKNQCTLYLIDLQETNNTTIV